MTQSVKRAMVLVLDSFGIGASKDAAAFGDEGANTLLSIASYRAQGHCEQGRQGKLHLPHLQSLGLDLACELSCGQRPPLSNFSGSRIGVWGFAREQSTAKDTTSGHWEMMGLPVLFDWGFFSDKQQSFPDALLTELIQQAGLPGILGNCHESGTAIIQRLGMEHMATGQPICYTSADRVFQIAYHESVFSPQRAADRPISYTRRACVSGLTLSVPLKPW